MVAKTQKEKPREVKLFIEGGGDSPAQHALFRENFHRMLSTAGFDDKHKPRIAVCGGRSLAYKDFYNYPKIKKSGYGILLVDSEAPVAETTQSPWEHLKTREGDGWAQPANTSDEQCHLMVQCMEAWFIADAEALKTFYGPQFKEDKLPTRSDVENISKDALFKSLESATKECKPKGCYSKGKHSFDLIGVIDPAKIFDVSPWAKRFFSTLSAVMAQHR
ncbi:DUF4276 family protein [Desulfovibrio sp. OttesenSCG-928-G11]|nr:DUF4276 family protein [Desulfovibrio sp. OttesenSCG-928-G11]